MLLFFKKILSSNKTFQDHLKVLKLTDTEAHKTHKHWSSFRRSPHSTKVHRHWSSQHSQTLKLYGGCRSSYSDEVWPLGFWSAQKQYWEAHKHWSSLYEGCRSVYSGKVWPLGFWSAQKQYWEAHRHWSSLYKGCRSVYSDEVRPLGFWSARKQYWEAGKAASSSSSIPKTRLISLTSIISCSPSLKFVWRIRFPNVLTILKRSRFRRLQQHHRAQNDYLEW